VQTNGDDYSILKKNVKFRKGTGGKVAFGFKQPNSISASVVRNVSEMADEEAEKVLMQVLPV
jgi:hypothetical protein